MVPTLGVRKGAWTEEEDNLLRKCIEIYGEGKWHQVPLRAGLNRCRKSCRLRWLNYLKPNIKRGEFAADEVDLMVRLHKLLGNRWSLIAARLPGRTSNDVKNFWNTHMQKKLVSSNKRVNHETTGIVRPTIIRPRPRIFSRSSPWLREKFTVIETVQQLNNDYVNKPSTAVQLQGQGNDNKWWESFLDDKEGNGGSTSCSGGELGVGPIANLWIEETTPAMEMADTTVEGGSTHWSDMSFEADDIWNLLGSV